MKKVISFSLYGDKPIYNIGVIRNAELAKEIFPDWEMWVYYNNTVPQTTIDSLNNLNVKLIYMSENKNFINSTWRFWPISDPFVDILICRDADSRLSERDKCAVDEWIKSSKTFHIIRDHPVGHWWPMNAGMWGVKGTPILNYDDLFYEYLSNNYRENDKSFDQCFLKDVIYPMAIKDLFLHDEYYNYEKIGEKIKRDRKIDNFAFIGECISENDTTFTGQRETIIERYEQ